MKVKKFSKFLLLSAIILVTAVAGVLLVLKFSEKLVLSEESKTFAKQSGSAEVAEEFVLSNWTAEKAPNYFEEVGPAVVQGELAPGEYVYCDLDELGRTPCAAAVVTKEDREAAKAAPREDISNLTPSGWGKNFKTVIPSASPEVEGAYSGWFWNRSHLIADSLGGAPVVENVMTGTRPQNVGNRNNKGGMAFPEEIARNYLDSPEAEGCPLYYGVVPRYVGDELIPRYVTVDMLSCDGSIDQRFVTYNFANGFTIDYLTGEVTDNN